MNVYELAFAIVAVVTIGRIMERRYASRRQASDTDGEPAAAGESRLDALEERIQVLERIVTDQGYELRQQFRDLER